MIKLRRSTDDALVKETAGSAKRKTIAGSVLETREHQMLAKARRELAAERKPTQVNVPALFLGAIVILSLASFLYLAQTSQLTALTYQLDRLESAQATMQRETDSLQVELARQEAPDKIWQSAVNLGMSQYSSPLYLEIDAVSEIVDVGDSNATADRSDNLTSNLKRVFGWALSSGEAKGP
jgi:hypothetical protein